MKWSLKLVSLLLGMFALSFGANTQAETRASPQIESQDDFDSYKEELWKRAFEPEEVSSAQLDAIEARFMRRAVAHPLVASEWRLLIHFAMRTWRFDRIEAYRQMGQIPAQLLEGVSTPLPVQTGASDESAFWRMSTRPAKLIQDAAPREQTPILAIVFHPSCGVCKRLLIDIGADAEMLQFFRSCSVWVGTIEGNFSVERYADWAAHHPDLNLRFVRDWKSLASYSTFETPTFRLLKGGVVVDQLIGWPVASGKARLSDFLKSHDASLSSRCVMSGKK